jgi:NAD(P)-dependent dehydrogenase (short-subunit alcohol dehydrogenase family)
MDSERKPAVDIFPIGVVEHSGRAYWTWKIGWMLCALLGVLALGTAVLFQAPSITRLASTNHDLLVRVRELRDTLDETRIQLDEAKTQGQEVLTQTDLSDARTECRNLFELAVTDAQIANVLAQNAFVTSLATIPHGTSLGEATAELEETNAQLSLALAERHAYEDKGAPIPCTFEDN